MPISTPVISQLMDIIGLPFRRFDLYLFDPDQYDRQISSALFQLRTNASQVRSPLTITSIPSLSIPRAMPLPSTTRGKLSHWATGLALFCSMEK